MSGSNSRAERRRLWLGRPETPEHYHPVPVKGGMLIGRTAEVVRKRELVREVARRSVSPRKEQEHSEDA